MITFSMETGVLLVDSSASGPNFESSQETVEQLPGTRDEDEVVSANFTNKGTLSSFFSGGAIDLLRKDFVTSFLGALGVAFFLAIYE